jgi:hypothetical protein
MRRIGNRLVAPLFALLMVASLAFGVTTTFATPGQALTCPNDPPTWLGTCTSDEHCTNKCRFYGGDPIGDCTSRPGCCVCLF